MREFHRSLLWLAAGLAGALAIVWLYPRVFSLVDLSMHIDRATAEAIALERLRDFGTPVEKAYVIVTVASNGILERRLQHLAASNGQPAVAGSRLAEAAVGWRISVYEPAARSNRWTYRAEIGLDGQVLSLVHRVPEDEGGEAPDDATVRRRAEALIGQLGLERTDFTAEPILRRSQTGDRLDVSVRYRFRDPLAGAVPHGVEVIFAGDMLAGFRRFTDEPELDALAAELRGLNLLGTLLLLLGFVMVAVVVVPFLKRYHDGQLGIRRGAQILLFCLVVGVLGMLIVGPGMTEDSNWGNITRRQNTWIMGAVMFLFGFVVPAVSAAMAWPLGEWWARGRWPEKLAAFDALFRRRWLTSDVAHSSARGTGIGLLVTAASLALLLALRPLGVWPMSVFGVNFVMASALPGVALIALVLAAGVPTLLFAYFLVPTWAEARFGRSGFLLSIPVAVLFAAGSTVSVVPLGGASLLWILVGGALWATFRFGDLLSVMIAGLLIFLAPLALPALFSPLAWLQGNGWLAIAVALMPLVISLPCLASEDTLTYRWDDVPVHVRRIAERERQRVELETARGIQQSILPELPPQLQGVEIAHSYLPASEVGGDFYDVLALEDGRLAVAVGDVAGHGVSSGLVMSMAKSALAVQVTFDPTVEAVLATLNRMVFQSARARLLTTLCYALVDPIRREALYACAGHLFPYRVSRGGRVQALEASSYPLGVRSDVETVVRTCRFDPGDTLFLYSDGLVEACASNSDQPFGFDRLEASLARHGDAAPAALRDGVLADVAAFTGNAPNEDDLTVLVLRLPAA